MNKIKILRIIARLNIGGPAIHAILLTVGLDKSKFDSLLVCGSVDSNEGDMFYYAEQEKVKPVFIPQMRRRLNFLDDLIALTKIYGIIMTEHPHIIHTHTAKAGALGRLAGAAYNLAHFSRPKPIVVLHTFHGHIFEGYFGRLRTKIFILIERLLASFTDKIITVSESVKKELISLGIAGADKIEVIPLGLELEKFIAIPLENKAASTIGIIGRLVPIKNHRLFLEAAAKLIKDNTQINLKFKIIGDGELRQELESHCTLLGISSKVEFLGWQYDLREVYSGLDIVALTSINEGTPVSLIEAMASGRVVVATDAGGVKDLLGNEIDIPTKLAADFKVLERGILVKPGDSSSFAAALTFILKEADLRKDICIRSREFVKNKFSKERLIEDMQNLYAIICQTT